MGFYDYHDYEYTEENRGNIDGECSGGNQKKLKKGLKKLLQCINVFYRRENFSLN